MTSPDDRLKLDELASLLVAERPEADPEFARKLDDWAAAGFPRGSRPSSAPLDESAQPKQGLRALIERISATPPRRILAPVGAAACLAVVAAVSVTQLSDSNRSATSDSTLLQTTSDAGVVDSQSESLSAPEAGLAGRGGASGAEAIAPEQPAPLPPDTDLLAPDRPRELAQDVSLALSTEPEELRDVADGVLEVTDRHDGFVVSSSVSSSDPTTDGVDPSGTASFELQIPADQLQATISELSDLAHVSSRSDGAVDITDRFTNSERRIDQLTQERERLIDEIESADTDDRRRLLRSLLDVVRARLDVAQRDLRAAQQRVALVPVSVSISADEPAADGEWSLSEALDDAVSVLTAVAGIALVSAAVLLPLALLAGIAGFAWRGTVRRRREEALDER